MPEETALLERIRSAVSEDERQISDLTRLSDLIIGKHVSPKAMLDLIEIVDEGFGEKILVDTLFGVADEVYDELCNLFIKYRSSNPYLAGLVIEILSGSEPKRYTHFFINMVKHDDPEELGLAPVNMIRIEGSDFTKLLTSYLKHHFAYIREQSAMALGMRLDQDAISDLATAFKVEKEPDVKNTIATALLQLGDRGIVKYLWELFNQQGYISRFSEAKNITLLQNIGTEDATNLASKLQEREAAKSRHLSSPDNTDL